MKKGLQALRQLVTLNFVRLPAAPPETSEVEKHLAVVAGLQTDLLTGMHQLVFSKKPDHLVKRMLRQLQYECCHLLDVLFAHVPENETQAKFHAALRQALLAIGQHLETRYGNFFDTHAPLPQYGLVAAKQGLADRQVLLKAGLKRQKVQSELQYVLYAFFDAFALAGSCSYAKMHYTANLQQALVHWCTTADQEAVDEQLIALLVQQGFNEPRFCNHVRRQLLNGQLELANQREQHAFWHGHEKQLLALHEQAVQHFEPNSPTAKQQLLDFVQAELHGHRQKNSDGTALPATVAPYRVKFDISVDALAYLLRLFIEAGVLQADPRTQLLAFVAQHVETAGTGNAGISVNSLGTKYKQVVQHTAMMVRAMLRRMLKNIEANYGS